jgi:hypothetical protein
MEEHVLSGLPADHEMVAGFTTFKQLSEVAKSLVCKLNDNDYEGNQSIVILGISKSVRERLSAVIEISLGLVSDLCMRIAS